jgi:hypothetical protein
MINSSKKHKKIFIEFNLNYLARIDLKSYLIKYLHIQDKDLI